MSAAGKNKLRTLQVLACASVLCLLSSMLGCSMGQLSSSSQGQGAIPLKASLVQGHVHGGNQPVVGAQIQLYAAGTPANGGGYGLGATPLIPVGSYSPGGVSGCTGATCTTLPTTDSNGAFTLTGDYTCPATASQIYIVAKGGNPGLGGTTTNPNLAMMAALGTCPANSTFIPNVSFIDMNEVTTVSAVWALQQFMAAPTATNVGAPSIGAPGTSYSNKLTAPTTVQSGVIGLTNAFTTARVLADTSTGVSPNTNYPYATPESTKINTLANILAACVNTAGGTAGDGSACGNLFSSATPAVLPAGASAPADTIQAAWYLAQNPLLVGNGTTPPYSLMSGAGAPFQPSLASAPNDWTIAINYAPTYNNGGTTTFGVAAPFSVAIDAYGNAWFANNGGLAGASALASGVELGADGSVITAPVASFTPCATSSCGAYSLFTTAPATGAHTIKTPKAVAVDLTNNAWIANSADAIAIAAVPSGGAVAVLNGSTGTGLAGLGGSSGSTGYYVNYTPTGLAIDGSNNVFVSSGTTTSVGATLLGARSVAKLGAAGGTGFTYSNETTTTAPNSTPGGQALLAIDTNNNIGAGGMVWALNFDVCKIAGNYAAITPWGTINEFLASNLSSPNGSEMVSSYSAATVGAGSTTNCGSTSDYVGQVFSAGMANPFGIAIDRNNGAYISDVLTSSLGFDGLTYITAPTSSTGVTPSSYSVVDGSGSAGSSTVAPTAGTTLHKAGAVAVDGNNRVWIANQSANSVVEASFSGGTFTFLTPGAGGSGGVGFVHPASITGTGAANSTGIAIDPSGNVWVTNTSTSVTYTNQQGTTNNIGNSATVIVGAAAPVVTPLSLAITNNVLGTKP